MIPTDLITVSNLKTEHVGSLVFFPGRPDPHIFCLVQRHDEWPVKLTTSGPIEPIYEFPGTAAIIKDWRLVIDPTSVIQCGQTPPVGAAVISSAGTGISVTLGEPGTRGATALVNTAGSEVLAAIGYAVAFTRWQIVVGPEDRPVQIFRRGDSE